ncbi:MAG: zinc ABC transporter substrate-binding protein [Lautropia sp.]|nr:zinc ABC transporter substrate-binding protein [Lautropia sp.]
MLLTATVVALLILRPGPAAADARLPVVATFSILADVVARVGGDAVTVSSLVPAGADVHVFQPGPHHARQLQAARLVVSNGLGFEGWIDRLVRSSGYQGFVAIATRGIEPLRGPEHGDGHAAGADPHAWHSVPNMKRYVANIAEALCEVQPATCLAFRSNADRYCATLEALDGEIRASLATVPADRRKVITSHRAFAYYSREYGVQFLAPVGISTDVEPSAAAVGRLIRQIRKEEVNAFFVEGISDQRLIERIRSETGGSRPRTLYADGLSAPDGPAVTYEAMMRYNTQALTAALSAPAEVPPARR